MTSNKIEPNPSFEESKAETPLEPPKVRNVKGHPTSGEVKGRRKPLEHQQFFTKLAQQLIHALDATTQHGRVFRVDMRLRPLGESGPLVTNMSAFEDYYQEQGREWERYAMVKARILNSTGEYAQELQQVLQPFVFRRYIDYSAMDSLRDMKALINQEVRRRKLNNNIKEKSFINNSKSLNMLYKSLKNN